MDDNARPHRAAVVDNYLESEGITRMAWPAYSPDLNPIENLWNALGRAVSSRFPPPATLIELETALQEEWQLLNSAMVDHLIESMIRFVNTQLMALSDGELAFEGLEDRLEEIRATDAHYITQWGWSQLRNHRRLSLIDINLISMYSIDQEFPALKSISTLGISKAEISFVHPTAFAGLDNLRILDLQDNLITELKRSMLPNPAEKLSIFILSNNLLTSLPDEMFEGMPNLKQLELNYNKLVTLNEETFLWPLDNLQSLMLKGNEFRCDCRLRWMVKIHKPFEFQGTCAMPENLNGMSLADISESVLWC
ncbi:leucine-rich repeats and immunoglobulin-like domains protein 3 [Trichonephila clavipes]|nr:leucine-rich repeats and immunoglobulin-like domains protein 3 [Trichonephila clavipes]